jgi:streptogramin lyase
MIHSLTPKIYICAVACLAGLAFFWGRASGSDFDLAETAGTMRVWHNADGLPSDSVTAILQTSDGFLWVGTSAGLVRFDGVKFTPVHLAVSSTNHPVRVTALCEDSNGHLWIGTQQDGLFQLAQGKLSRYAGAQELLDDSVTSLAADNRGQVWIGSKSGLNLWSGQNFKSFTAHDGLPDVSVSGVNVARSGTVWITTRTGMCRLMDGHITPYGFQTESQGRSPEYLGAYEDRRGDLWAFGDTYLINLAEGKRFNYFRSSESASVRIWSLCEGRDGRIWIGTSGRGLFCFEDNSFQPVILGEDRRPYDVRAICEDREGNLWLGTSEDGLLQLRPQSVHVLRAGQGLPDSPPTALALDAGGRIYVGLQRGGLFGRAPWATGCMVCKMDAAFISQPRTAWPMTMCWLCVLMRKTAFGPAPVPAPFIVLPGRA